MGADLREKGDHQGSDGPQKGIADMRRSIIKVWEHRQWQSLVPRGFPALDCVCVGSLLMNTCGGSQSNHSSSNVSHGCGGRRPPVP